MPTYCVTALAEYYAYVEADSPDEALAKARTKHTGWSRTMNEPMRQHAVVADSEANNVVKMTVVGRYPDDGESFVDHVKVEGRTANDSTAQDAVLKSLADREGAEIVAVFEGHLFDHFAR